MFNSTTNIRFFMIRSKRNVIFIYKSHSLYLQTFDKREEGDPAPEVSPTLLNNN